MTAIDDILHRDAAHVLTDGAAFTGNARAAGRLYAAALADTLSFSAAAGSTCVALASAAKGAVLSSGT